MSNDEPETTREMLDHYDFSEGVQGKYARQYAMGTNVVLLEADLAELFPDSESVNRALRRLINLEPSDTQRPR